MPRRIFIANVGVNASHRIQSPIFADGSFELICIPEKIKITHPSILRYSDLSSLNQPFEKPLRYIPQRYHQYTVHDDPEFRTMTYGDECETSPRAAGLKTIELGDFLFFLARLVVWQDGHFTNQAGFYFVGFFEIEKILRQVTKKPTMESLKEFGENAHIRRALADRRYYNGFWVFKGSSQSLRFRRAVPLTRNLADRVFRSSDGRKWSWDDRTSLQSIGSYTRACRCFIDPDQPGRQHRALLFWQSIRKANPEVPTLYE